MKTSAFWKRIAAAVLISAGGWPAAAAEDRTAFVGVPLVRDWVRPEYPAEALKQKREGSVNLQIVVDETGAVTSARALRASAPEFEAPAVAAVKQWKFSPATEGGKAVTKCVTFTYPFNAADMKKAPGLSLPMQVAMSMAYAPRVAAKEVAREEPDYPATLEERGLPGKIKFEFVIGANGQPKDLKILGLTHSDFVPPALAALKKWRYEPAHTGDLVVESPMQTVLEFGVIGMKRRDLLVAAGCVVLPAAEGAETASDPTPSMFVDPVYPRELAAAGTTGEASAELTVGADGAVTAVNVVAASEPAFGRALAAGLAATQFAPARKASGEPVAARLKCTYAFKLDGTPEQRLAEVLRSSDGTKLSAKGLDAPLRPVLRFAPELLAATGEAPAEKRNVTVEFVIDREGRARLPRVLAGGENEAAAWAAATAVSRWVFEPPRRGGQAAEVLVSIPMVF